ncbi:MIP/aquaporin family protein [Chitinophaga cymbidii]|uniref:Putative glycerol uptake facilitator protein n=1 Tax=Chitinophaga cymbidii TaxID=1096750 RepID=A0A512RKS9_9BACT|nr:MIP/aquaporin family protein [Chitinophaga cymbidii]GEP96309.1 putative glycerol uptake facilitator protein [Chitinophaga cymbidii]
MSTFLAELIGTALLILLGDGVVANCVLNKSKGQNGGWIVITMGWAMAVFVGVFAVGAYSGAHLNSAVTLALAVTGGIEWAQVPAYLVAQLMGAILGACLVWVAYKQQFDATDDPDGKLAVFCTAPAVRGTVPNLLTEIIGTFVLIFGVFYIAKGEVNLAKLEGLPGGFESLSSIPVGLGAVDALPVALLVLAIGLSLGGPTGYAINPARDLGPRIAHFILPIKGKRDSDWGYAWIPVVGPVIGALLAAALHMALK